MERRARTTADQSMKLESGLLGALGSFFFLGAASAPALLFLWLAPDDTGCFFLGAAAPLSAGRAGFLAMDLAGARGCERDACVRRGGRGTLRQLA